MIHVRKFQQLSLKNFHPQLNVIVGKNAQGKTSILEALSFIGQLQSFRTHASNELLKEGFTQGSIKAQLENPSYSEVLIGFENKRKTIQVDTQKLSSKSKYPFLGLAVSFIPDDLLLIKGSPEPRRSFLDQLVVALDPAKEQTYKNFQKVLKQRNRLLKQCKEGFDIPRDQLFLWTEQYIDLALKLYAFRQSLLDQLQWKLSETYSRIFNSQEKIWINYQHGFEDTEVSKMSLENRMGRLFEAEKAVGYSLVGPHRDDIEFQMENLKARSYASQGQTRSLVIALKIAQIELLQSIRNQQPILLLDDIISELDDQRTQNLVQYLANYEGQLFVTTAEVSKVKALHEQFPDFKLIDLSDSPSGTPSFAGSSAYLESF